jgi:glycosyltransferase involved in cell wall biosynthesis
MKILFDMQAHQAANRIGGIGKYNYDFLTTLFSLYPNHQYRLIYNNSYSDKPVYEFKNENSLVKSQAVNYLPGNDLNPLNHWIQYLVYRFSSADIIHILSPFEEQRLAVILNEHLPHKTIITVYDFIPLIFKNLYLSAPLAEQMYLERTKILKSAGMILAISEATRQDAINLFNIPSEKVVNIGIAPSDDYYKVNETELNIIEEVKTKYEITGNFILTVSNIDHRKNLGRLLSSYLSLPKYLIEEFPLVVVTNSDPKYINASTEISEAISLGGKTRIRFLYGVSNQELRMLYNSCSLFVYASLYEGGGLPVIEAMKCGAPVVASNTSSIPEYVGRSDNLFNPYKVDDIACMLEKMLTDSEFCQKIRQHGLDFSKNFTWEAVVKKAVGAYDQLVSL